MEINYRPGAGPAFRRQRLGRRLPRDPQDQGDRGWLEAARASKDPTVFTVLFEDTTAMLGLLTALVGVALAENLNMAVLDGLASIVIGIILAVTAAFPCL